MAPPMLTRGRVAALLSLLAGVILFGYHARRIFVRRRRKTYEESGAVQGVSCTQETRSYSAQTPPIGSPRAGGQSRQGSDASSITQSPVICRHAHQQESRPAQSPSSSKTQSEDKWGLSSPSALSSLSSLTDKTDTDTEIEEAVPKTGAKHKKKMLTKKSRLPLMRKKSKETEMRTSESESDGVFVVRAKSTYARKTKPEESIQSTGTVPPDITPSSSCLTSEVESISGVGLSGQTKVPYGSTVISAVTKEDDSDEKTLTSEGDEIEEEASLQHGLNKDMLPEPRKQSSALSVRRNLEEISSPTLCVKHELEENSMQNIDEKLQEISISFRPETTVNKDSIQEAEPIIEDSITKKTHETETEIKSKHVTQPTPPKDYNIDMVHPCPVSIKKKAETFISQDTKEENTHEPEKETKKGGQSITIISEVDVQKHEEAKKKAFPVKEISKQPENASEVTFLPEAAKKKDNEIKIEDNTPVSEQCEATFTLPINTGHEDASVTADLHRISGVDSDFMVLPVEKESQNDEKDTPMEENKRNDVLKRVALFEQVGDEASVSVKQKKLFTKQGSVETSEKDKEDMHSIAFLKSQLMSQSQKQNDNNIEKKTNRDDCKGRVMSVLQKLDHDKNDSNQDNQQEKLSTHPGSRKVMMKRAMFEPQSLISESLRDSRRKSVASVYPSSEGKSEVSLVQNKIRMLGGNVPKQRKSSFDDSSLADTEKTAVRDLPEFKKSPGNVLKKIKAFQTETIEKVQAATEEKAEEETHGSAEVKDPIIKESENESRTPLHVSTKVQQFPEAIKSDEVKKAIQMEFVEQESNLTIDQKLPEPSQLEQIKADSEESSLHMRKALQTDDIEKDSEVPIEKTATLEKDVKEKVKQEASPHERDVSPAEAESGIGSGEEGDDSGGDGEPFRKAHTTKLVECNSVRNESNLNQVKPGESVTCDIGHLVSSSSVELVHSKTENKQLNFQTKEEVEQRTASIEIKEDENVLKSQILPSDDCNVEVCLSLPVMQSPSVPSPRQDEQKYDGIGIKSSTFRDANFTMLEKEKYDEASAASNNVEVVVHPDSPMKNTAKDDSERSLSQNDALVFQQLPADDTTTVTLSETVTLPLLLDTPQKDCLPLLDLDPPNISSSFSLNIYQDGSLDDSKISEKKGATSPALLELERDLLGPRDNEDQESILSEHSFTVLSQPEPEEVKEDDIKDFITSVSERFDFLNQSKVETVEIKTGNETSFDPDDSLKPVSPSVESTLQFSIENLPTGSKSLDCDKNVQLNESESDEETQMSSLALKAIACESRQELELKRKAQEKTQEPETNKSLPSKSKLPALIGSPKRRSEDVNVSLKSVEVQQKRNRESQISIPRAKTEERLLSETEVGIPLPQSQKLSKSTGELDVKSRLPTKIPSSGSKTPPRKLSSTATRMRPIKKSNIPESRLPRSKSEGRSVTKKEEKSDESMSRSLGDKDLTSLLDEPPSHLFKTKAESDRKTGTKISKLPISGRSSSQTGKLSDPVSQITKQNVSHDAEKNGMQQPEESIEKQEERSFEASPVLASVTHSEEETNTKRNQEAGHSIKPTDVEVEDFNLESHDVSDCISRKSVESLSEGDEDASPSLNEDSLECDDEVMQEESQATSCDVDSLDSGSQPNSANSEVDSDEEIDERFNFNPEDILYEHPPENIHDFMDSRGVIYERPEFDEEETSFIDDRQGVTCFGDEDIMEEEEEESSEEEKEEFDLNKVISPVPKDCEVDSLGEAVSDDNMSSEHNVPDLIAFDKEVDNILPDDEAAMTLGEEKTFDSVHYKNESIQEHGTAAESGACSDMSSETHTDSSSQQLAISAGSIEEHEQGVSGVEMAGSTDGKLQGSWIAFAKDEVKSQIVPDQQSPYLLPPPGAGKGRRVRHRGVQPDSPRSRARNREITRPKSPELQRKSSNGTISESVLERVPLLDTKLSPMSSSTDSAKLELEGATAYGEISADEMTLVHASVSDDGLLSEAAGGEDVDPLTYCQLKSDPDVDVNPVYRRELKEMFRTLDKGMYRMTEQHAKILVRHLATQDFDFLRKVLVTISNAGAFTRNQDLLREAGCLQRLSQLLRGHSMALHVGQSLHYPAVVSSVATTISNLAVNEENQSQLQECIPALIDFAVSEKSPESVQLSSLQALTNLSVTPGFHAPYTKLVQTLYELVDTHDEPRQLQALKVLVNLSSNPDMVPHLLAAKTPVRFLELLSPGTDEGVTLRWINILANVIWTAHDRGITYATLPTEYKAASPETLYTALYGHSNSVQLRSKVFVLSKSKNQDIRYHAARIYSCLV